MQNVGFHIPPPWMFNPLKHHRGYVLELIEDQVLCGEDGIRPLAQRLLKTGHGVSDFYFGKLHIPDIIEGIEAALRPRGLMDRERYEQWINRRPAAFRQQTLADGSRWTLRTSGDALRYIHLHPSRYSRHSFRLNGLSLKTAIAVIVYSRMHRADPMDLNLINEVRVKVLKCAPLKRLIPGKGLSRVIGHLNEAAGA